MLNRNYLSYIPNIRMKVPVNVFPVSVCTYHRITAIGHVRKWHMFSTVKGEELQKPCAGGDAERAALKDGLCAPSMILSPQPAWLI